MRKYLKILFACLSIMFVCLLLFFLCAKLIPLDLTSKSEKITLYDMNQEIFYESNFNSNITWHELEEYPQDVLDLIVKIEDKRFYNHLGFDVVRLSKAIIKNIQSMEIQEGASSISQQLAKNLFLSNKQTLSRKLQELFYAVQMEMQYSKEEILEGYCNTLYFGHGIFGFFKASEFYYGIPLEDCSQAQIIALIGIINGPSIYSPYINLNACLDRKDLLVKFLYQENALSLNDYQKALDEKIVFKEECYEEDQASYFIQAVLDELNRMDIDTKSGIDIYTTYNPKAQKALFDGIKTILVEGECERSGIILDPESSEILAISGGKNYTISEFIRPLYSKRQVGSAIKPLLYYNALHAGFTPSTTFMSTPTTFQIDESHTYSPTNYKSRYPNREISLINAISLSDNIYAVKTHLFLGMDVLSESLNAFHVSVSPLPSLALGTSEMTLLNLASIYNTFASGGVYSEPYLIQAIYENQHVIYEHQTLKQHLLDLDETLVLNQLLTSTFDKKNKTIALPTLSNLNMNVKVSAKSGTSDFDSLTVGFNPDYTVAIWVGFDDARMLDEKYFEDSKKIFQNTFNHLYDDQSIAGWYEKTKKIESRIVDPISGLESLLGSEYWYIKD